MKFLKEQGYELQIRIGANGAARTLTENASSCQIFPFFILFWTPPARFLPTFTHPFILTFTPSLPPLTAARLFLRRAHPHCRLVGCYPLPPLTAVLPHILPQSPSAHRQPDSERALFKSLRRAVACPCLFIFFYIIFYVCILGAVLHTACCRCMSWLGCRARTDTPCSASHNPVLQKTGRKIMPSLYHA